MPRSSGTYSLPAGQPVVAGTTISDTTFNTLTADIANELTNSIPRDGTAPPTANLPLGNFKITGLGNGTLSNDAAAFGQIVTTATGITCTPAGNIAATNVQAALNELDTEKAKLGAITASGLTQSTARLLGRTTAATGAVEEITVAGSLTFAAGTLTGVAPTAAVSSDVNTRSSTTLMVTPASLQGVLVSGTSQLTTSGTSIDFTGIPAWAKRITVMFNGISTNGVSPIQIQIGNGSIVTTGYNSNSTIFVGAGIASSSATTGFTIETANASLTAPSVRYGILTIANIVNNIWVSSSTIGYSGSTMSTAISGSNMSLASVLDRIRLTTVNGTDTFDAGSINILWE